MSEHVSRRGFIGSAGLAAGGAMLASVKAAQAAESGEKKIIAVSCSRREGKTTAEALKIVLEAAKAVSPETIEIELIELAGKQLHAELAAGIDLAEGATDDFLPIEEKLSDPKVAG